MRYEAPRLIDHGTVASVTAQGSLPEGNDPCRFNPPRNEFKQTGPADHILGNPNQNGLATCSPTV